MGFGAYSNFGPVSTSSPAKAGVESLRHVCDHSAPTLSKVKDAWKYTFTSPYIFVG